MTDSPGRGRLVLDTELLNRIAAGESLRSLGRERGVSHSTLSRRLRRPEMASELRAAKQRLRAQRAKERRVEKELRRRARRQAAANRGRRGRRGEAPRRPPEFEALSGTDLVSRNDELAAKTVAAGGGIQELIEATGLRTRLAVYESIDPEIVVQALANDARRPSSERQGARRSRRFTPDPALIARRAAGEPLRRLAQDAGVSPATLSRSFALPDVADDLRLQQLKLRERQSKESKQDDQSVTALLANHYARKITDIWCPVHNRRTYVTSMETSESETRLEVAGCCEEAIRELMRWLKIHRALPPTGAVFTPSGHAPANATVPPA